jgi:glyoxylase I family protein
MAAEPSAERDGRPRVRGLTHVSLSVSDLERSRSFYHGLLGLPILEDRFDGVAFDGREVLVLAGRTAICLQEHRANDGDRFDPTRTGLDHLALAVDSAEDLNAWADHLDAVGVEHSEVQHRPRWGAFIELRDPDGVQLELHWFPAG